MKRSISLFVALYLSTLNASEIPSALYQHYPHITPESNYKIYQAIEKAKESYQKGQLQETKERFIQILKQANRSKAVKNIDQYDFLYANYVLLTMLGQNEKSESDYKKLAKYVLHYLDKETRNGKDIWEEGDLGQLQLKMYQTIANHTAKILYKESNRTNKKLLREALSYAKKATQFIRSEEDNYLKETKMIIENALAGNPPLKGENEIKIIKVIKKAQNQTKSLAK